MAAFYTIGHSNRSLEQFIGILAAYDVKQVVDVRRVAASRRFPHFCGDVLQGALPESGIGYSHEVDLGGGRAVASDSPNTFWRNETYRAYADYLASGEFQAALARLVQSGLRQPTAIMCSAAVPWRCHRQLIADVLVAKGCEVYDIFSVTKVNKHALHPNARLVKPSVLVYEADAVDALGA